MGDYTTVVPFLIYHWGVNQKLIGRPQISLGTEECKYCRGSGTTRREAASSDVLQGT